jgi:hypothetical protein
MPRWMNALDFFKAPDDEWLLATQVAVARIGRFDITFELPG